MPDLTATVAETRASFSKIAAAVRETGRPVTVFKNSRPWVSIAPLSDDHIPAVDWAKQDIVRMDSETGVTTLPAEWDDEGDEGVYDDLV